MTSRGACVSPTSEQTPGGGPGRGPPPSAFTDVAPSRSDASVSISASQSVQFTDAASAVASPPASALAVASGGCEASMAASGEASGDPVEASTDPAGASVDPVDASAGIDASAPFGAGGALLDEQPT